MSITITWKIAKLYVQKKLSGYNNCVIAADWVCTGTDGTFTAVRSGKCDVSLGAGFTPYESLTEEQVISWCWDAGVNRSFYEADITTEINNQADPPVVTPPLPWASQP